MTPQCLGASLLGSFGLSFAGWRLGKKQEVKPVPAGVKVVKQSD